PALIGGNEGDISNPQRVRCGRMEVAIEQVGCNRQTMSAGRGRDPETALAACPNAMPLHQPLHPLFAYAAAPVAQFSPNARPPVGPPILRKYGADVNQHCLIAQVAALENMPAASKVFMVAGHAHPQPPALHADGPHPPIPFDKGVLHFRSFAKYAVGRVARRNCTSRLSQNRAERSPLHGSSWIYERSLARTLLLRR